MDPNGASSLRDRLRILGVPNAAVDAALSDPARSARNVERSRAVRGSLRGCVPQFEVRCGGGEDLCSSASGVPTSPGYFARLFDLCIPEHITSLPVRLSIR